MTLTNTCYYLLVDFKALVFKTVHVHKTELTISRLLLFFFKEEMYTVKASFCSGITTKLGPRAHGKSAGLSFQRHCEKVLDTHTHTNILVFKMIGVG